MSDPSILFVKPGAISSDDKTALGAAGVIVVEMEDPQSVRLVKASAEISGSQLLTAAMRAIKTSPASSSVRFFHALANITNGFEFSDGGRDE